MARVSLVAVEPSHVTPATSGHTTNMLEFAQGIKVNHVKSLNKLCNDVVVTLHVVATYKYLGNYISDDLSDDDDINRQRRTLYGQRNIILQKMCGR